jgi:hypothetical protein
MHVNDLEFHVTLILIDNLIPEQGYAVCDTIMPTGYDVVHDDESRRDLGQAHHQTPSLCCLYHVTHPPCMIRVKTPLLEVIWEPGLIFLGDAQELALLD